MTNCLKTKTYAEKYMVVQPGQVTPWHFHWCKTEDLLIAAADGYR